MKKITIFFICGLMFWLSIFIVDVNAQNSNPSITIISPNGEEQLLPGSDYVIKWETTGDIQNVYIRVFFDISDVTCPFGPCMPNPYTEITTNAPNTGSFSWHIDDNIAWGEKKFKIDISDLTSHVSDESDNWFNILTNNITCNESWLCGDWSTCSNGRQTRLCNDLDDCGTANSKPVIIQDCKENNTDHFVLQLQRQVTDLEKQVIELERELTQLDQNFAEKYTGIMFLDVENHGRLWYVDPVSKNRFYFMNGEAALSISSKLATGITYEDIQKIPVGISDKPYNLKDSDGDGLPDRLESALGSDPDNSDTDSDGLNDKQELENGYNPMTNEKYNFSQNLIDRLEGKMLLQVSGPNSHGEIWYIKDGKRWYGGTKDSMYEIMRARSLGAKAVDIRKIVVGAVEQVE